jgi:peroxiredoxin
MKKILFVLLNLLSVNYVFTQGYKVGDMASDFKLKNVDGKMVSLADFKDANGFIVIFTCNHCPYAIAYEDRIIQLNKMFKPKGYPVIAINPNDNDAYPEDSYENMIVRAKEKGFTYPYLFDEGQKIYLQYGATRTPHVFILKKEPSGMIVKYIGAIDNNHADAASVTEKFVENAVNALLSGKDPYPATTKAIGCSIKPRN